MLDERIEMLASEIAQDLKKRLRLMTKEELLRKVLKPKYARLMKDFSKEQILDCILKKEEDIEFQPGPPE